MKVIRNHIIPFGRNYGAINLFGVVFAKHGMRMTPETINHEAIHTAQMRELLFIPFYVIYVLEWLFRLIATRGNAYEAYRRISFEREAYARSSDSSYLSRRKRFAQWGKTS